MKQLSRRTIKKVNIILFLIILLFLILSAAIWISTAAPGKRKNTVDNVPADAAIGLENITESDFEQQQDIQQNYQKISGFKINVKSGIASEDDNSDGEITDDDEFIFPDSYQEELTESDAKKLKTAKEVQDAINYIYARSGCIFGDEEVQNYFEKFSWYNGRYSVQDMNQNPLDYMTEVQYQNIQILAKRRRKLQ